MPTMVQAGVYSSVLNYLKAVKAAGTDATAAVMKQLKSMPIEDAVIRNGRIREDGRLVHDMLLLQVKKPSESKAPWDYYTIKARIPGDDAFLPPSQSKSVHWSRNEQGKGSPGDLPRRSCVLGAGATAAG